MTYEFITSKKGSCVDFSQNARRMILARFLLILVLLSQVFLDGRFTQSVRAWLAAKESVSPSRKLLNLGILRPLQC